MIPAFERATTLHALDYAATVIGSSEDFKEAVEMFKQERILYSGEDEPKLLTHH
jgi:hypothetical protein